MRWRTRAWTSPPLIDQSFPKGMAFARWLAVVKASPVLGELAIHDIYDGASNVDTVVPPTQRWLYTDAPRDPDSQGAASIQHLTFNTPVGVPAEQQCGRVTFSQFHVVAGDSSGTGGIRIPQQLHAVADGTGARFIECGDSPMSPQEKALEFMLFDASSCLQPDTEPPRIFQPPPPAPPVAPPVIP